MNEKVKEHYNSHLAEVYGWMAGDFGEKVNQTRAFFIKNNIKPSSTRLAIDLGSGHGIQSAALADIGFNVTAVDFSEKLLEELKQNTGNRVETIIGDIAEFEFPNIMKPELILCMGDTLTHLTSKKDVSNLLFRAAGSLNDNGRILLSYRDLSVDLKDTSRFINVKSDSTRILNCFLEYENEKVTVTDILHEYVEGKWVMKISSYPKLKLPLNEVEGMLRDAGLIIALSEKVQGMNYIIAERN